jgi:hypothetical protein
MERVNALINILHEQSLHNADPASLLVTVQMLQSELSKILTEATSKHTPGSKVVVVMPAANGTATLRTADSDGFSGVTNPYPQKAITEPPASKQAGPESWTFDPIREIPTLAHQEPAKELNDAIGQPGASLNDKLKTPRTEVAEILTEAPIKDLKKAIGINDRYVFLNELFRGDDAMYERSIKTINNFRILPEAEYWIERELKVKLGWDDGKTITQHFYQLVKRRFS